MAIIFYDHLVYKTEIHRLIDDSEDEENVKNKAKQLVDDIIHQGIIEYILDSLDSKRHHTFLEILHERPYDPEIIQYLRQHISTEIEEDISRHVNKLIDDIKQDLLISSKK